MSRFLTNIFYFTAVFLGLFTVFSAKALAADNMCNVNPGSCTTEADWTAGYNAAREPANAGATPQQAEYTNANDGAAEVIRNAGDANSVNLSQKAADYSAATGDSINPDTVTGTSAGGQPVSGAIGCSGSGIHCNYCGGFEACSSGGGCRDQAIAICPNEAGVAPAVVGAICLNADSTVENISQCSNNYYYNTKEGVDAQSGNIETKVLVSGQVVSGQCPDNSRPTAGGQCWISQSAATNESARAIPANQRANLDSLGNNLAQTTAESNRLVDTAFNLATFNCEEEDTPTAVQICLITRDQSVGNLKLSRPQAAALSLKIDSYNKMAEQIDNFDSCLSEGRAFNVCESEIDRTGIIGSTASLDDYLNNVSSQVVELKQRANDEFTSRFREAAITGLKAFGITNPDEAAIVSWAESLAADDIARGACSLELSGMSSDAAVQCILAKKEQLLELEPEDFSDEVAITQHAVALRSFCNQASVDKVSSCEQRNQGFDIAQLESATIAIQKQNALETLCPELEFISKVGGRSECLSDNEGKSLPEINNKLISNEFERQCVGIERNGGDITTCSDFRDTLSPEEQLDFILKVEQNSQESCFESESASEIYSCQRNIAEHFVANANIAVSRGTALILAEKYAANEDFILTFRAKAVENLRANGIFGPYDDEIILDWSKRAAADEIAADACALNEEAVRDLTASCISNKRSELLALSSSEFSDELEKYALSEGGAFHEARYLALLEVDLTLPLGELVQTSAFRRLPLQIQTDISENYDSLRFEGERATEAIFSNGFTNEQIPNIDYLLEFFAADGSIDFELMRAVVSAPTIDAARESFRETTYGDQQALVTRSADLAEAIGEFQREHFLGEHPYQANTREQLIDLGYASEILDEYDSLLAEHDELQGVISESLGRFSSGPIGRAQVSDPILSTKVSNTFGAFTVFAGETFKNLVAPVAISIVTTPLQFLPKPVADLSPIKRPNLLDTIGQVLNTYSEVGNILDEKQGEVRVVRREISDLENRMDDAVDAGNTSLVNTLNRRITEKKDLLDQILTDQAEGIAFNFQRSQATHLDNQSELYINQVVLDAISFSGVNPALSSDQLSNSQRDILTASMDAAVDFRRTQPKRTTVLRAINTAEITTSIVGGFIAPELDAIIDVGVSTISSAARELLTKSQGEFTAGAFKEAGFESEGSRLSSENTDQMWSNIITNTAFSLIPNAGFVGIGKVGRLAFDGTSGTFLTRLLPKADTGGLVTLSSLSDVTQNTRVVSQRTIIDAFVDEAGDNLGLTRIARVGDNGLEAVDNITFKSPDFKIILDDPSLVIFTKDNVLLASLNGDIFQVGGASLSDDVASIFSSVIPDHRIPAGLLVGNTEEVPLAIVPPTSSNVDEIISGEAIPVGLSPQPAVVTPDAVSAPSIANIPTPPGVVSDITQPPFTIRPVELNYIRIDEAGNFKINKEAFKRALAADSAGASEALDFANSIPRPKNNAIVYRVGSSGKTIESIYIVNVDKVGERLSNLASDIGEIVDSTPTRKGFLADVGRALGFGEPVGIVAPGFRGGELFGPKGSIDNLFTGRSGVGDVVDDFVDVAFPGSGPRPLANTFGDSPFFRPFFRTQPETGLPSGFLANDVISQRGRQISTDYNITPAQGQIVSERVDSLIKGFNNGEVTQETLLNETLKHVDTVKLETDTVVNVTVLGESGLTGSEGGDLSIAKGQNVSYLIDFDDAGPAIFKPLVGETPLRDGIPAGTYYLRESLNKEVSEIFKMDELVGYDLVPATTIREIQVGDELQIGSIQRLIVDDSGAPAVSYASLSTTQRELVDENLKLSVYLFDLLAGSEDRLVSNILVTSDPDIVGGFQLHLIDNGLSFGLLDGYSANNRAIKFSVGQQIDEGLLDHFRGLRNNSEVLNALEETFSRHNLPLEAKEKFFSRWDGLLESGRFPNEQGFLDENTLRRLNIIL